MTKIQDYAVIGNTRSSALISLEGSIDWLCWPRFDSPSIFASLLDDKIGGRWKITPKEIVKIERSYIEDTNILQTHFHTKNGLLQVTDYMLIASEKERKKRFFPEAEIVRDIVCLKGHVDVVMEYSPRPNYAVSQPRLHDNKNSSVRFDHQGTYILRMPSAYSIKNKTVVSQFQMRKEDRYVFSLTYVEKTDGLYTALDKKTPNVLLKENIRWWKKWAKKNPYQGFEHRLVIRSALTLKLLSYSPSGAFIAAPTTSLPERIGGHLNWDYRYCWLRDTSFITRALYGLNYKKEAESFIHWLIHSTKLSDGYLGVFFDVNGKYVKKEKKLSHLKGYKNSRPVRVGNAAENQFQLDIYGEVVEAIFHFVKKQKKLNSTLKKTLKEYGEFILRHWDIPDNGMWEYREKRQIHTSSLLMCWLALQRLIEMKRELNLGERVLHKFKGTQQSIEETIKTKCWNEKLGFYTTEPHGSEISVNLLFLGIYGFEAIDSPRMKKTFKKIQEKLRVEKDLYYRNEKGIELGEGIFNFSNFTIVEYLAKGGGTLKQAKTAFKKAIAFCNDVGLLSEEMDVKTKNFLGNFPQGFTHATMINAALAIQKRETNG